MEDVHALAVLQPLLIGRPLLPITGSALAAQLERLVDALLSGEISERTAPHHLREIVGELKSPQMVRPSG